jgi:hypothetical protein
MTFLTGLTLYGLITAGVASGLAVFQWVIAPFGEFVSKLKETVDERDARKAR